MGGYRKPRRPSKSSKTDNLDEAAKANFDFNKVLQEVEGGFQVTWKEILLVLVGIVLLAIVSICVGIAAGMTISIHYYESQSPAVRRMDARDTSTLYSAGRSAYQKVTTLDPNIASSNVMQKERDGLDLGKVITTTASGQLDVLMVVEETAPLHSDGSTSTSGENHSDAYSGETNSDRANHYHESSAKRSPMTMTTEEANLLVPGYGKWKANQPNIELRESTIHPTLCSDGHTHGFDNWPKLKAAVQEANSISAERFMKWSAYFANVGKSFAAFDDELLYYERDVVSLMVLLEMFECFCLSEL
jgi:hypothetical protein